jgi:hypothetical protein
MKGKENQFVNIAEFYFWAMIGIGVFCIVYLTCDHPDKTKNSKTKGDRK